jgi:hypothetical protein
MTVQLRNDGVNAATAISATLSSSTPGVTITPGFFSVSRFGCGRFRDQHDFLPVFDCGFRFVSDDIKFLPNTELHWCPISGRELLGTPQDLRQRLSHQRLI